VETADKDRQQECDANQNVEDAPFWLGLQGQPGFEAFLDVIHKHDLEAGWKLVDPLFQKFGLLNFYKLAEDGLIEPSRDKAHMTSELIPLTIHKEDDNQHAMDNLHFVSINYG